MKLDIPHYPSERETAAAEGLRALHEELKSIHEWTKTRWPATTELHAAVARMMSSAQQLADNYDCLREMLHEHSHCLGKGVVHDFAQRVGFCSPRESLCMIAGFLEEIRDQLTWRES